MPTMPALFIGHGSPMNTLELNRYTRLWRDLGGVVPKPRAILAISAHWYMGSTAVTGMLQPRTIHDFYGFPLELSNFQYPAAGAPDVAGEVIERVKPMWCGLDHDSWGLDHGTWSVLAHMFPNADVPVLQLSLNATKPLDYHFKLGASLAPLRENGILIVCSGNVVHNLRLLDWSLPDGGKDWAIRFDEAAQTLLTTQPDEILKLSEHPDYAHAVPTPDHFLPLLYFAGLASTTKSKPQVPVTGHSGGSLSMTCYTLDTACPETTHSSGAATIPASANVPLDQMNI
jgi:4,5-DOPA dioxygenase extradiol